MKILFNICLGFLLMSCSSSGNKTENASKNIIEKSIVQKPTVTFKTSEALAVYNAYESLRDALIASDFENTKTKAVELKNAIGKDTTTEPLSILVNNIVTSESLVSARSTFYKVNQQIESVLIETLQEGNIFKAYCPMALDNTGAFWFTTKEEILNPYFGDSMLKCGTIQESIK